MSKIYKTLLIFLMLSFLISCSDSKKQNETSKDTLKDETNQVNEAETKKIQKPNTKQEKEKIGGQRNEHGCLGPAGYTWCEAKQKCLRTWEEPCE